MLTRNPTQYRGRIRWRWRRIQTALRYGWAALAEAPIVFGNAIPKSGSKLLFNILRGLVDVGPFVDAGLNELKPFRNGKPIPQGWINGQLNSLRPGDIRLGYLAWNADTEARMHLERWAVYQIFRDPRDVIVSEIFYAMEMHAGHAMRAYLYALPDMEARIETMIQGIPEGPLQRADIRSQYERYLPWIEHPEMCVVRYERLVAQPEATLAMMLAHLRQRGFDSGEGEGQLIARLRLRMAPSKSETFRKGGSGGWRQHFTEANRRHFDRVAGDLLPVLGYER